MKFYTLVWFIGINMLTYTNFLSAQNNASPIIASLVSVSPSTAVVNQLTCSMKNDRVLLNWTIDNNQSANQIEIESSTDGKNFTMAALVFGTDQKDTGNYAYYEKAKKAKIYYRLKIISKDSSVQYSDIVTP
jgi:ribosome-binding ATPase YchF (GTP1/OBG family)